MVFGLLGISILFVKYTHVDASFFFVEVLPLNVLVPPTDGSLCPEENPCNNVSTYRNRKNIALASLAFLLNIFLVYV